MAMSFTDYQQAVRGHLDDRMAVVAATTPIYWPNLDEPRLGGAGGTEVAKPVPGDPAWIMADVQTDDNLRTASGGNGTAWENLGALMVQVFGSRNVGEGEVEGLAETIAAELRDANLLGGKLSFENVTTNTPAPDPEGWWMQTVRGEFSYITN